MVADGVAVELHDRPLAELLFDLLNGPAESRITLWIALGRARRGQFARGCGLWFLLDFRLFGKCHDMLLRRVYFSAGVQCGDRGATEPPIGGHRN